MASVHHIFDGEDTGECPFCGADNFITYPDGDRKAKHFDQTDLGLIESPWCSALCEREYIQEIQTRSYFATT